MLNTNGLWMPDGSKHYAFWSGGFLAFTGVDLSRAQESQALDGACLPTDQPYSYHGPIIGLGGCKAGFFVRDHWTLFSASLHPRFRWRYVDACGTESNPVLKSSVYAPHVGMALAFRVAVFQPAPCIHCKFAWCPHKPFGFFHRSDAYLAGPCHP